MAYNFEAIFSEGYVDAQALRILLESVVEDQKVINDTANKKVTTINKMFVKTNNGFNSTAYASSQSVLFNFEELKYGEKIQINNKEVYFSYFDSDKFIKNVKNIECYLTPMIINNGELTNVKETIKVQNGFIRVLYNNRVCISSTYLDSFLSSEPNMFIKIDFKYKEVEEETEVENEEFNILEDLLLVYYK